MRKRFNGLCSLARLTMRSTSYIATSHVEPKNLYNIYSGLLIYDFVPEPVLQHRGDDSLSPGAPAASLLSLPRPYQVGEAQIGT